MPNTILPTTKNDHSVSIETLSEDFVYSSVSPHDAMRVREIEFHGAAGEFATVRNADDGHLITILKSIDGGGVKTTISEHAREYNPAVDMDECNVPSGTAALVIRYTVGRG